MVSKEGKLKNIHPFRLFVRGPAFLIRPPFNGYVNGFKRRGSRMRVYFSGNQDVRLGIIHHDIALFYRVRGQSKTVYPARLVFN